MPDLELLAEPSTFTCPECHGTLWELKDQRPQRFRCHTGHAYTGRSLIAVQNQLVEETIWAAMRALQEREMLLRRMAQEALVANQIGASADFSAQAGRAQQNAELLRGLIVGQPEEST